MSDTSTPIVLAIFWAIFLALAYFSVFRTPAQKPLKGRGPKTISAQKPLELNSVLIVLAIAFVIRIVLALSSKAILDLSSPAAVWWHNLVFKGNDTFSLIMVKLPAILADVIGAFLLYKLSNRHLNLSKNAALGMVALWAFNPYSLFAAASYAQFMSVALTLSFGALYLMDGDNPLSFLGSGLCIGFAVLLHPYMLYAAILILIALYFSVKESKNLFAFVMFLIPAVIVGGLGTFVFPDMIDAALLERPTVNAFNFYTLMDSWKTSWYTSGSLNINSKLFFLPVPVLSSFLSVIFVLLTAFLYARSGKKDHIFFYLGLLCLSLYMFAAGVTPFAVIPAALCFYIDFALSASSGSVILGFLSSVCGLLNLGYLAFYRQSLTENVVNGGEQAAVLSALILLFTLIIGYFCAAREHGKEKEEAFLFRPLVSGDKRMGLLDWVLLAVFTVVALFSNFWELGDTEAPSSAWKATEGTETIVEVSGTPTRMSYFLGLGATGQALQVELEVQTSNDGENWNTIQNISTSGYCYTWYDTSLSNAGRYLKFIENADHMQVLEIGLYNESRNQVSVTVLEGPDQAFDEQHLAEYGKTYKNSMYFDEVYHGRTAYEVTEHINEYEWTHPPLGKLIMSLGIRAFGMNPFGWRAAGALFGALLVPLMYLFGKKLFGRTLPAAGMAFLMLFDSFRFAQTRIATIDTYGVFFIILMYYFMYDFYTLDFKNMKSPWEMWRPLLLSGIFMGIGCAAKWIGFYAAVGLAILFFMAFYRFSKENKKLFREFSSKTIGLCVIFFGVIPFLIYYASYLPHLSLFDYKFSEFIHQQESMYSYHSGLESTHSYSSPWYMWPFMIRPVYMCGSGGGVTPGFSSLIAGIGNPAIWWLLVPALIGFIYLATKKMKDHRFSFLIIGFLAQYLSWVLIARTTYQYHFFASLPFLFAVLIYVLFWLKDNYKISPILWGYALVVVIAFIAIFPAVSGLELPSDSAWRDALKAFDTWNFL